MRMPGTMVWRRVMCVGACILLAGCDDADDRVPEQAEPFELRLRGNVCESAVDYQAPEGTNLSLVLSGSGKLQTLLFADGAPVNPNNPEALASYMLVSTSSSAESCSTHRLSCGWARWACSREGGCSPKGWARCGG